MGVEPHLIVQRGALQHAVSSCAPAVAASASAQQDDDIAVLWGSSLHFVCSKSSDGLVPRLSPVAQLVLATLQAERSIEAVLVPHWWWRAMAPAPMEPGTDVCRSKE